MLADLLRDQGQALALAVALMLTGLVGAWALLVRPAPAGPGTAGGAGAPAPESWSAVLAPQQRGLVLAALGLLAVAATAFALSAVVRDRGADRYAFGPGRGELIERELRYQERMYEHALRLLQETHAIEMQRLREGYESEIAALRSRYAEVYQSLTVSNEELVRRIAQQYGLNPEFFAAVSGVESGFDSTIANPESGARGLFQFMPATWNDVGSRYADRLAETGYEYEPVTRENRGQETDPRNDARLNAVMGALLTLDNIEYVGTDDPAIVYLAHFAGPEMAAYVNENFETNPDEPIRDVVRRLMPGIAEAVIEQNAPAYTETMTVRDFYQYSAARFAGIDSAVAPDEDVAVAE
jgi:hypothetical protein